ncbi:MAG: helix-turn-helix domain-containing protein [Bacteroidales bacterium]|nr:helix-turn-helix domain-containing protein [Bacteroidales bacterium]
METRKNRKWTYDDKLEVVRMYEKGYGCNVISYNTGITKGQVILWLRRYRELGLSGLEKQRPLKLSPKVKAEIMHEIKKKGLSLQSASITYGISPSALWQWQQAFCSEHSSVLPAVSKTGKPMGRPKKKTPQTELEKLRVENLELKAELAYLKKVRALVEQRENCVGVIVPKPSKD